MDLTHILTNVLTLVAMLGTAIGFLMRFSSQIERIVSRMDQFDKEVVDIRDMMRRLGDNFERVGTSLMEIAKQQVRLDGFERRYEDATKGLEERIRALELAGRNGPVKRVK